MRTGGFVEPALGDPAPSFGIPDAGRGFAESGFGMDFSDVRVHDGGSAAAVGAQAYAQGDSIHFGDGPAQHTAAHELAHVVQQRAGLFADQY